MLVLVNVALSGGRVARVKVRLFFFVTCGHSSILLLTLHHLEHLDLAVLRDEFSGVHVTTADTNNETTVDNLGQNVALTKLVLTLGDTLHINRQVGFVKVLCKRFIDDVTCHRLVQLDLLQLEHFLAQVRIFLFEVLSSPIESPQVLE